MFKGPDVLRVKGILNLKGEEKPVVIQGVQHIFHPPVRLDAWPAEDRRTRLVFITRDISADDLRGTLALMTAGLDQYGLQRLAGEAPSPASPPSGCHFHPRCPRADATCRCDYPAATQLTETHIVRCFHAGDR